jgi:predicted XRE-type DNA-binding protein
VLALTRLSDARGWTQAEAARQLGVTQPSISDLVRGKIDRCSFDTLVDLLTAAGAGVTVTVRRRRSAALRCVAPDKAARPSACGTVP